MGIKSDLLKEQLKNAEDQLEQAKSAAQMAFGAVAMLKHLIQLSENSNVLDAEPVADVVKETV